MNGTAAIINCISIVIVPIHIEHDPRDVLGLIPCGEIVIDGKFIGIRPYAQSIIFAVLQQPLIRSAYGVMVTGMVGADALALTISHALHWKLSRAYLFTDVAVLLLSLTYIPPVRIVFSLITVTISSHLTDWIRRYRTPADTAEQ